MREYTKEEKEHIKAVVEARLEGREVTYDEDGEIVDADFLYNLIRYPERYSIKPQTITCYMYRFDHGVEVNNLNPANAREVICLLKTWEEEVPES